MRGGELVGLGCRPRPDPDWWSGPLHWPREDREVGNATIATLVGKRVLRPGFVDDFDAFGKKFAALIHRAAEAVVTGLLKAAAGAKVESAVAQDIDHGIVLG